MLKELCKIPAKESLKSILLSRFYLYVKLVGKHSGHRVQCCDTDCDVKFFLLSYVIKNLYWGMRPSDHFVNALNLFHNCCNFPTFQLQQLLLLVILFHKLYFINFRSKHWCWQHPYKFQTFWDVKPYRSLLICSVSSRWKQQHTAATSWNWRWHHFDIPKLLLIWESDLHNISENFKLRQHHSKEIKSRISHKTLRNFFNRLVCQWDYSLNISVRKSALSFWNVDLVSLFFYWLH